MDELIRTCSTGTPKEFACKIGISERTLYEYLSFLKNVVEKSEVSVLYNDMQQTYEYNHPGRLEFKCTWIEDK